MANATESASDEPSRDAVLSESGSGDDGAATDAAVEGFGNGEETGRRRGGGDGG